METMSKVAEIETTSKEAEMETVTIMSADQLKSNYHVRQRT